MDKFLIVSGHRVGSRWVHYLLSSLYGIGVSPEISIRKSNVAATYLADNKIPKFHATTYKKILEKVPANNYKILCVVRNPRDRAVSFAFHNRYHDKNKKFKQRSLPSDLDAIKYTIYKDRLFRQEEKQQQFNMLSGYSTKNKIYNDLPYLWTTYEWLKENIYEEILSINKFINFNATPERIKEAISAQTFRNKSGRKPGQEDRKDVWRRKGVVGDYKNWFDDEMLEATKEWDRIYWEKVDGEINGY